MRSQNRKKVRRGRSRNAYFIETLCLLNRAEQDIKLFSPAMTSIFCMLSTPAMKRETPEAEVVLVKLVAVLDGLLRVGAGEPLPRSVIHYRDITKKSVPSRLKSLIKGHGGLYRTCVSLYTCFREVYIEWARKNLKAERRVPMRSWAQILRKYFGVQKKLRRRGKLPLMWGQPGVGKTVTLAILPKGTHPPITPKMMEEMQGLTYEEMQCETTEDFQRAALHLVMEKPKKRKT